MTSPAPDPTSLGALRASGHVHKPVKVEIRDNLLARLAAGETVFPGILGFDDTVLPQVERALLAGHDLVLLGERGQGKTRLIRTLVGLLDAWTPVIPGCEINDHPYAPVCGRCTRLVAEQDDATSVTWKHRSDRYGEKLATPDTSVGDLIGDVDPIKVAEGRTLGDPETVHYGLVPRTNRGIFSVNELPDLAERIQVALLNVLEERDIQVRGYTLRLPLDLLLVASANPEDYTNRGRIITPLKDRFGAEVRTHYPLALADEVALIRQEAVLDWPGTSVVVPDHLLQIVARYTRLVRESPQVDQRSGVSARFAVAATETVAASAVRRAALTAEPVAVARVCDLPAVVAAARGKVEFEAAEEGRELEVLHHLLRRATADAFRALLAGTDLTGLQRRFDGGATVETGDLVPATDLLGRLGALPGLAEL
ncbi:MAG: sigma 54-interacting transcriptional regulator, partial [Actinomycetota bacterium]|nr:sigma 54-interacting transcriptional regulator [Actinomycetota bacterium]